MTPRDLNKAEALMRRAIGDPGSLTGRGFARGESGESVYEELVHWQARAAVIALEDTAVVLDLGD